MSSILDGRACNELVNAALTISRLRHSHRQNEIFLDISQVAPTVSHASADAMRVAKEAIQGYIDQLPPPAAAIESQSSDDTVLNMDDLERVPIVEDAENQSAGRQSRLPVGDPTDENNSDTAPEQVNSRATEKNNHRIASQKLAKLEEEIGGKLEAQKSTRNSLPDDQIETWKQRVIKSIIPFTDVALAPAIDLIIGAALGNGMCDALNSLADQADFLSSYKSSGPSRSGGFGAAKSSITFSKSQPQDLPPEVNFRLKLYGTANWEGDQPDIRGDYYGVQDMRMEQSWAKLVAILSPAEPFPIDDLLAYADIEIVNSTKQVGLIKLLPSHDDALEKQKIKEKVKGMRYDKDGAVISAPIYYRALMIAYLLACAIGAITVGYYDPAKRKNDYARVADSATFITVTVVTVFTLIKLLFNEPDVLRNLVLGKWVLRERTQVYRYLGSEKMAKKVLAMENDRIEWLDPTDMCFARGRMCGKMELRDGLETEVLHNIGYVTGKQLAYDFVKDRTYKIKHRNGICIIDKASESETFPGIRNLWLHLFKNNTFAGTGTETSLRQEELSAGPRPDDRSANDVGTSTGPIGAASSRGGAQPSNSVQPPQRTEPGGPSEGTIDLTQNANQEARTMSSGAASSRRRAQPSNSVQPPQRTEPGGPSEGTIDLSQIGRLAVPRGTFGQQPPQEDTLFGIPVPGVDPTAECGSIEEILRNSNQEARTMSSGAASSGGGAQPSNSVQPPQRTEPGGPSEGKIDLSQIVPLAVARGTFGQRQPPQEDTLFGIPVPGVGPAAVCGSIEEILRNMYPELARMTSKPQGEVPVNETYNGGAGANASAAPAERAAPGPSSREMRGDPLTADSRYIPGGSTPAVLPNERHIPCHIVTHCTSRQVNAIVKKVLESNGSIRKDQGIGLSDAEVTLFTESLVPKLHDAGIAITGAESTLVENLVKFPTNCVFASLGVARLAVVLPNAESFFFAKSNGAILDDVLAHACAPGADEKVLITACMFACNLFANDTAKSVAKEKCQKVIAACSRAAQSTDKNARKMFAELLSNYALLLNSLQARLPEREVVMAAVVKAAEGEKEESVLYPLIVALGTLMIHDNDSRGRGIELGAARIAADSALLSPRLQEVAKEMEMLIETLCFKNLILIKCYLLCVSLIMRKSLYQKLSDGRK